MTRKQLTLALVHSAVYCAICALITFRHTAYARVNLADPEQQVSFLLCGLFIAIGFTTTRRVMSWPD